MITDGSIAREQIAEEFPLDRPPRSALLRASPRIGPALQRQFEHDPDRDSPEIVGTLDGGGRRPSRQGVRRAGRRGGHGGGTLAASVGARSVNQFIGTKVLQTSGWLPAGGAS